MSPEPALVRLSNLTKRYGATYALNDFSLSIQAGEVVSLVGENGAGKSTLGKILAGVVETDSGWMDLNGKRIALSSPRDALRKGIGLIPQELAPVPTMSLAENLFLGALPATRGLYLRRSLDVRAKALMESMGLGDLDIRKRAREASLHELQILEIAKAVRRNSKVMVFDEPSAALSEAESKALYLIVRRLTANGVGIVYISHRMEEVFEFSDRICVMRSGLLVSTYTTRDVSRQTVIHDMVGHEVVPEVAASTVHAASTPIREVLRVSDCTSVQQPPLTDLSFTLHEGEILGVYGLRGSGAESVAAVLGGRLKNSTGRLFIAGNEVGLPTSPRRALKNGIRYLPPDRKKEGLALALSVADNVSFPAWKAVASKFGFVRRQKQTLFMRSYVQELGIKLRSATQKVGELSGGNQQKVLLASRLAQRGRVLVLHEPTRGVDVGARADIQSVLGKITRQGSAVLLVSSDVEEVVAVCNRVLIIRDGRLAGEIAGHTKTQEAAVTIAARNA